MMRFLGKRIGFHGLQRKLRPIYNNSIVLAIEKMQLHININSLPKERKEVIESRINELEAFDKKANFFKNTVREAEINTFMSSSQYFEFITDDELFECVPIHMIVKLLMNNRTRDQYLSNLLMYKNRFGIEFLEFIMKQENPLETIDYFRRFDEVATDNYARAYNECLKEHPSIDKDVIIRNLIYLCSISSLSRIRDKVKTGEDIFDIEKFFRTIIESSNFSTNKNTLDADYVFTYLYGLHYREVDNIINKYGADLEYFESANSYAISKIMELNPKHYQRIIALYPTISMIGLTDDEIRNIDEKRLDELTEAQKFFSIINEMKSIVDALKNPNRDETELIEYLKDRANNQPFLSYIDFQQAIIKVYENEFNRVLYNPVRDAIKLEALSSKLGVDVYEIDYEKLDSFYGLFREENIFHPNIKKIKDDRYKVNEDIHYDGIATSPTCGKNFKLVPKLAQDVINGYTHVGEIQNMAPWDFVSWKSIQDELTPERETYDKNPPGIVFHMPTRLMEHARLGPPELAMYGYQLADGKFKKILPDYYFYEIGGKFNPNNPKSIEANIERLPEIEKNNDLYSPWYLTVSEAKHFGKPILLGNTQKFLDYYKKIVTEMQDKLISSNSIHEKIELMQEMILIYEGCCNSMNTANTHRYALKSDFFGAENRREFYNSILGHIENIIKANPEQGKELLLAYKSLCEKELAKLTTISHNRGGGAAFSIPSLDYQLDNYSLESEMIYQLDKISIMEAKQFEGEYTIFKPNPALKELMKAIRKPIGKEVHYNVPGAIHGIEHADKVTLIGDAIAQREGISDRDRKIVNIACMLHDWKRVDNSRNRYHGRDGAELIVKEFKAGNLDFLDLTEEDIPMLATAVCYHNFVPGPDDISFFKRNDILNEKEISKELQEFGVAKLNLSDEQYKDYYRRTMEVCSIVRDADNLDRFRFTKDNEFERPTYSYCLTDSAKSTELRAYANLINQLYARMVLEKNHPNELLEENEDTDYVKVLYKIRSFINGTPGRNFGENFAEEHEIPISIDELWDRLYSLNVRIKVPKPIQKDPVLDSAIDASKEVVRTGTIKTMLKAFQDGIKNLWHDDTQR